MIKASHRGASTIEYALMVAVVATALVSMVSWLDGAIGGKFASVVDAVSGGPRPPALTVSITN